MGTNGQGQTTELPVGKNDLMSIDFDEGTLDKGKAFKSAKPRCPKCGGMFSDLGVCHKCGFVEPAMDAKRRQRSEEPLRLTGFQLWMSSLATDGVSISAVGYALFASACFFCLLVMAWGILSTSLIGAAITSFTFFILFFVVLVFLKTRELATVRNADLGVLAPFWTMLLVMARMQDWQKYDANLKGRKIIDCRSCPVDDIGLTHLDGLSNCNVLDLENSTITDAGLQTIYSLTKLQCLVLRNTNVTDEAVTTLHQHYPKLWIWK